MRALAIAATGMQAQQKNLDVIAHNIANINTTGFKRGRVEFTDLIYDTERLNGIPNRANSANVPEGAHFGLGVRTASVRNVHLQGQVEQTGNRLDLALTGNGWVQIENAAGETVYQRSGAFNNASGAVFARVGGAAEQQEIGQLSLATFANDVGLTPLGDNLFAQSDASGEPQVGTPGDPGFATIRQGYLESSNVESVKEITQMISAQRGYGHSSG